MIIIPSVEATVLGELRTQLPKHSVTVVPEGYEPPEAGIQTIGAAFVPTPEGRGARTCIRRAPRLGVRRVRPLARLRGTPRLHARGSRCRAR